MPKLAPYSAVLKQDYEAKTLSEIPAGNWVSVFFDTAFPLTPDVEAIEFDQDATEITQIVIKKDRVKMKLNVALQAKKKIKLKVRPKRMI